MYMPVRNTAVEGRRVMERCKESIARSTLVRHISLIGLLLATGCAVDTQYTVNTTGDFPDADPGDRVCAGSLNLCSLRAAIEETNTHPPGERVRIVLPAGTYEVDGALVLTHDNVTIRGDDRDTTTIRQVGSGARVLTISDPGDIVVERVTLTGGSLPSGSSGGAVEIDGTGFYRVSLSQCRISENQAGFLGGGVYAEGEAGILNILNCIVENNDSTGDGCTFGGGVSGGGGVMTNGPTLLLLESEVRDNCGSNGGGVRVDGGLNHLILRSTIAANGSATRAGGLYIQGGAEGSIVVSTIAENSGPEAGGVLVSAGSIEIRSATIVGNNSGGTSFGPVGAGGILATDGAQVSLQNTVIASNIGGPLDCSGQFFSGGGNFVGEHEEACDIAAQATDVLDGGFPGLGALSQGGGPTRTMLPNANSPLVNAGVAGCGPVDQREQTAPMGAACDIGAVERQ
jgi:CSLREA domain-containing protein